jgi:outer membrane protein OmpA-like peptidoglycan-associated protein
MRNYLITATLISIGHVLFAQNAIVSTTPKNCFEENYNKFNKRDAYPIKDGEHQISISFCKEGRCNCLDGKVKVLQGAVTGPVMIKMPDGTFEAPQKKIHSKMDDSENYLGDTRMINKGILQSLITDDSDEVNIFFIDCLMPESAANGKSDSLKIFPAKKELTRAQLDSIILKNAGDSLKFEKGKAILQSSSLKYLDDLTSMIKRMQGYQLKITSHTDNVGDAQKNLKLSKERAQAVKDYLVKQGLDGTKISCIGKGGSKPVATNSTPAGRAKNNRAVFELKTDN